jgi:hypothetical protein
MAKLMFSFGISDSFARKARALYAFSETYHNVIYLQMGHTSVYDILPKLKTAITAMKDEAFWQELPAPPKAEEELSSPKVESFDGGNSCKILTQLLDDGIPAWKKEGCEITEGERQEAMQMFYNRILLSMTGNQRDAIIRDYWDIPPPTYEELMEMNEEDLKRELKLCELSGLYAPSELSEIRGMWEIARVEKQIG